MYCNNCWSRSKDLVRKAVSEIAPHVLAIQADFRASGDRLLDSDQTQKRHNHTRNCVNSILQAPHRQKHEEELLECQEKDTQVNKRTAELYSEQRDTDITELVVIDETQCEK